MFDLAQTFALDALLDATPRLHNKTEIFQKLARMYLYKYKLLLVVLPHQPQSTEVMTYFLDVYLSGMHPDLFKFRLQIIK